MLWYVISVGHGEVVINIFHFCILEALVELSFTLCSFPQSFADETKDGEVRMIGLLCLTTSLQDTPINWTRTENWLPVHAHHVVTFNYCPIMPCLKISLKAIRLEEHQPFN